MTCAALIAGVLLLVSAWVALAPGRYPLTGQPPVKLEARTADGWTLAVWHRAAPQRRFSEPVVLCHGLANNHHFFEFQPPQSLAHFLADLGFDCYCVDLRGAGASRPPTEGPWDVSVDDHLRFDLPALLATVRAHSGSERLLWVGHSLGGLVGLAGEPHALRGRVQAMVTIGSPVYFMVAPHTRALLKLGQWLAPWGVLEASALRFLAPFGGLGPRLVTSSANLGNLSARSQRLALAHVFADIWRGVLAQLEDWVRTNSFRSTDLAVDYRRGVRELRCPVLVVGGSVDGLSPEPVTRQFYETLGTPRRALALFGKAHGHRADYGHGDLVLGDHAHEEVYPVIGAFLARHATALEARPAGDGAPAAGVDVAG